MLAIADQGCKRIPGRLVVSGSVPIISHALFVIVVHPFPVRAKIHAFAYGDFATALSAVWEVIKGTLHPYQYDKELTLRLAYHSLTIRFLLVVKG
jgi:hypothetical protein